MHRSETDLGKTTKKCLGKGFTWAQMGSKTLKRKRFSL